MRNTHRTISMMDVLVIIALFAACLGLYRLLRVSLLWQFPATAMCAASGAAVFNRMRFNALTGATHVLLSTATGAIGSIIGFAMMASIQYYSFSLRYPEYANLRADLPDLAFLFGLHFALGCTVGCIIAVISRSIMSRPN